jgi:aminoglycoside phosphotransferase (APT) family kinase protein
MDKSSLQENLQRYLNKENSILNLSVSELNEINVGWETELFTFKATCDESTENLVVRIFSGDNAGDKAVSEFQVMNKLAEVGYPVPRVYHVEASGDAIGKPFIVMERIMGGTLDDAYTNDNKTDVEEGIERLVELFILLHRLDVKDFRGIHGVVYTSIDDYLDYYKRKQDMLAPWLSPVIEWLKDHKPNEKHLSVCHNDFHGFNILLDEEGIPYVIDWGFTRISDSRIDLGWTVLLYSTFGSETLGKVLTEKYAQRGGVVESLNYFVVMAMVRRIDDLVSSLYSDASSGLKPDALDMMRGSRHHFFKVRDMLEEYTAIRIKELDEILNQF